MIIIGTKREVDALGTDAKGKADLILQIMKKDESQFYVLKDRHDLARNLDGQRQSVLSRKETDILIGRIKTIVAERAE